MPSIIAIVTILLAGTAYATPVPQDVTVNGVTSVNADGSENVEGTAELVCAMGQSDPLTWANSGAEAYLNDQLNQFGPGERL
jgi:hypothetical protein